MDETATTPTGWTRRVAVRLGLLLATGAGAAVAALALGAGPAAAGEAAPGTFTVTQPNGEELVVRQWGDEWYHGLETNTGYTILQRADGYWVYATGRPDGTVAKSPRVAGRDAPAGARHVRDEVAAREAMEARAAAMASPAPDDRGAALLEEQTPGRTRVDASVAKAVTGDAPTLVILAQFTDRTSLGTTPAQWHDRFFGAGKTVRDYYDVMSRGALDIVPAEESSGTADDGVVGWVTLDIPNPGYVGDKSANKEATKRAIIAADPFVDYSAYDTDDDGVVRNTELHVVVVAAGYEASYARADPANNVWAHNAELFYDDIPLVDGALVGGWGYTQVGEMHARLADPSEPIHQATVGILVHELGHDLGLPDLYDYDYDSEGVGEFSLMAAGEWTQTSSDQFFGETPIMLDAWSRATLGWIDPVRVNGTATRTLNAAGGTATTNHAVVLGQNPFGYDWDFYDPAGGEFFMVENRQPVPGSYDEPLPAAGLLVLHVDESKTDNTETGARIVDVEEADGLAQLDTLANEGDAGDLFPGSSDRRSFGAGTNPSSAWNDGTASGVAITGISDSAAAMTATFTGPANTAPRNDAFADAVTVSMGSWGHKTDNALATIQNTGEASQGTCDIGKTVWYRFTPPRDMYFEAHTYGSAFDTVINLWRGDQLGSLTPEGCNDEDGPNSGYSYLSQRPVEAGQTYYLQVGGYYDGQSVAGGDLWLTTAIYPRNDIFAQAVTLTGASGTVTGNSEFSVPESGEPKHAGLRYTGSVWYRWTAPATGQYTFDTLGSAEPDTVLGVYTGTSVSSLTPVASNNDVSAGDHRSQVAFGATAGTTYRIAVGHQPWEGGGPGFTLAWGPARASATSPPRIAGTARFGSPLTAEPGSWPGVDAFGYEWRRDGAPIAGASGPTYTPTRGDVGRSLTVTVTGTGPGLAPGSATSGAVVVAKAQPQFGESRKTARKRAKGVERGRSVVLKFTLGPWADGGEVTAVLGRKSAGKATVASGKVVIRISTAKAAVGKKVPLVLRFAGTATTAPVSHKYTLRVRPER